MDQIVTQYLPEAFAFIYTINSANAGGVQKDRVSKIDVTIHQFLIDCASNPATVKLRLSS